MVCNGLRYLMFLEPPRPYRKTSLGEENVTGGSGGASGKEREENLLEHGPRPHGSPSWWRSTNSYSALKNMGLKIESSKLQLSYRYPVIFNTSPTDPIHFLFSFLRGTNLYWTKAFPVIFLSSLFLVKWCIRIAGPKLTSIGSYATGTLTEADSGLGQTAGI